MTNEQLMYATMLALTKQNMAIKVSPLSTAMMQGQVIQRNIVMGETVCCYYNGSENLLKVGEVPAYSGNYFIDDNLRMYDLYNGKIRIRDALSGTVYDDQSVDASQFEVYNGGSCCAYLIDAENQTWRIYTPEGTYFDKPMPTANRSTREVGYRNGYIAIATRPASGSLTVTTRIYDARGNLVSTLSDLTLPLFVSWQGTMIVPISSVAAMLVISTGAPTTYVYTITTYSVTQHYVWDDVGVTSTSATVIGCDQSYMYGLAYEVEEIEGETVVFDTQKYLRWSIDNYQRTEIVRVIQPGQTIYNPPSVWGTIAANLDGTVKLYNIYDLQQIYEDELPSVPGTRNIRETEDFLWIPGSGVYQKVALGWLMYPTSIYPRTEPWGKLGYSIRNTQIGKNGLAIVLFE